MNGTCQNEHRDADNQREEASGANIPEKRGPGLNQLVDPQRQIHSVENPADGIHGDEEYLYVVELPTQNPFDEPGEWTVRVSEHSAFPLWDGPTDEAFERTSWQFHGPLEDALTDPVTE